MLSSTSLPKPPGNEPVKLEIALHRGIWIEGRITERASGRPVGGVAVHYQAFVGNAYAGALPEFFDLREIGDFYSRLYDLGEERTKADGTYRLVGCPDGASSACVT